MADVDFKNEGRLATIRTVCRCCEVTRRHVEDAVYKGARDFDRLQEITGAGMGCGTCWDELERALFRAISDHRTFRAGQQALPL